MKAHWRGPRSISCIFIRSMQARKKITSQKNDRHRWFVAISVVAKLLSLFPFLGIYWARLGTTLLFNFSRRSTILFTETLKLYFWIRTPINFTIYTLPQEIRKIYRPRCCTVSSISNFSQIPKWKTEILQLWMDVSECMFPSSCWARRLLIQLVVIIYQYYRDRNQTNVKANSLWLEFNPIAIPP